MSSLSSAQIEEYRERGYLHVPALVGGDDLDRLRVECDRLAAREGNPGGLDAADVESFPRQAPTGQVVRNLIDPIVPHSSIVRALVATPAVLDVVRSLFDDDPWLFKDKLILKPPGTAGYGLHQDFAYWGWTGVPPDQLLALQIAIDDADEANGALRLHPNCHHGLLPPTVNNGNDIAAERVSSPSVLVPTKAGDALVIHSLTPHASDTNLSDTFRRTLYLTYNAARSGDLYRIYYQDRGDLLRIPPLAPS
jgi:2-aminoethylphosphonate dioxygenase